MKNIFQTNQNFDTYFTVSILSQVQLGQISILNQNNIVLQKVRRIVILIIFSGKMRKLLAGLPAFN